MHSYANDVFEGFDVSEDEVAQFRNTHAGFGCIDMSCISQFLLIQLASISKKRTYNTFSVTDVIQELEGVGRGCKQKVGQFKHLPLKGFWKAHFFDERFMARNLINHWGLEFETSTKFDTLCARMAEEERKSPSNVGWQGRLAHEMIVGGYEERARKNNLTGEWIIFTKHENKNYYLCISKHTSKKGDQHTFEFLRLLIKNEYPFLRLENPI